MFFRTYNTLFLVINIINYQKLKIIFEYGFNYKPTIRIAKFIEKILIFDYIMLLIIMINFNLDFDKVFSDNFS